MKAHLYLIVMVFLWSTMTIAQTHISRTNINDSILISILTGEHWYSVDKIELTSVNYNNNKATIKFNKYAIYPLVTAEKISVMTDSVRKWIGNPLADVSFIAEQRDLTTLIPQNHTFPRKNNTTIVQREGINDFNLKSRTFAIWNSHGRYYERSLDRWEWQRARLFTTVEDLLSTSFVIPYLIPMLENAGATVFTPRERDTCRYVIFADNDKEACLKQTHGVKMLKKVTGFKAPDIDESYSDFYNPFCQGTSDIYRITNCDTLSFCFNSNDFPNTKAAFYMTYTADAANCEQVKVTIESTYGSQSFLVNEQIGGSMWIFLGTCEIKPNTNYNISITGNGQVSVDAFRIGGGMGTIMRNGKKSDMPAYAECARYYLQSDGWSPSIYALSGGTNDYTDDINCRGEWVNALILQKGINIDAALAFHTDAGIVQADSTIGTLTIVNTDKGKGVFSDGKSKKISRALAQSIVEQIVGDIRASWDSTWSERGIWEKGYSEARRPNVPTVLLELLSHQNINDIHYALHPQFRFDVCRSIYKGLLRFFEGKDAIVQPLPIHRFGMELVGNDAIRMSWMPTIDPLEPSSKPDTYHIYASDIYHNDHCIATTNDTTITIKQITDNEIVEYFIVAENKGGRSFESNHLKARLNGKPLKMLLVDGYDRKSAPQIIDVPHFRGVLDDAESTIPYEQFRTGKQFDFNPDSQWIDDDAPGCGASYADEESRCHNMTFNNYPQETFIQQSKEYFENSSNFTNADSLHIHLGYQRNTWYGDMSPKHNIYNKVFLEKIECASAIYSTITISGAYTGTDITNDETAKLVSDILGFTFRTNNASKCAYRKYIDIHNHSHQYLVEHPDAIEPTKNAQTIERYKDSNMSAAIRHKNIFVFGY